jgi:hypothetical protein
MIGIMMAVYLINTDDPRPERVILWEDRFYGHIAGHPSVTIEAIRRTIENPDIITRDVKFAGRDNYYAKGNDPQFSDAYLKVCVQFGSDTGKVITAFPTDRLKPEEEILWQK